MKLKYLIPCGVIAFLFLSLSVKDDESKMDEYLLKKIKEYNTSNDCSMLDDAMKLQEARLTLIKREAKFKDKFSHHELTKAIEFNKDDLKCARTPSNSDLCSWYLKLTNKETGKKMDVPFIVYLLAIIPDKEQNKVIVKLTPDQQKQFELFKKANAKDEKVVMEYLK